MTALSKHGPVESVVYQFGATCVPGDKIALLLEIPILLTCTLLFISSLEWQKAAALVFCSYATPYTLLKIILFFKGNICSGSSEFSKNQFVIFRENSADLQRYVFNGSNDSLVVKYHDKSLLLYRSFRLLRQFYVLLADGSKSICP